MNILSCCFVLNPVTLVQHTVSVIILSLVFSMGGHSVVTAQTSSPPDPFAPVYGPEFSDVVKAVAENDYDLALKQLSKMRKDAIKTRQRALLSEIISTIKEVNRLKREFQKLDSVFETLQKTKDPKACRIIANFYCLEKGDWQAGLNLLTRSESPALRTTAAADLKRPSTPEEQVKLADAWWKVADEEKGDSRKAFLLRGRYWYLLSRPQLPAIERVDRDKKLMMIPVSADKIVIWNQHNGINGDRGTLACVVTLLYEGKSVWRQSVPLPWLVDAPASATVKPPHIRFNQVRIDITKFRGNGGGLGEVEVFDGTINVSQNCSVVAKEYYKDDRRFYPGNIIDGDKSGATGFWLLNNGQQGWVLIDMFNFVQQQ